MVEITKLNWRKLKHSETFCHEKTKNNPKNNGFTNAISSESSGVKSGGTLGATRKSLASWREPKLNENDAKNNGKGGERPKSKEGVHNNLQYQWPVKYFVK